MHITTNFQHMAFTCPSWGSTTLYSSQRLKECQVGSKNRNFIFQMVASNVV